MDACSLYLISPPSIDLSAFLPRMREAAATGAVKAFQLRLKDTTDKELLEAAQQIVPICREHDIAFILNDRPDLALKCGADGVHLGQEDMSVSEARKLLGPEMVIGATCHASRHLAMEAAEQGADYVAFGAFYPTTSKPKEKLEKWGTPEPDILEWWSSFTTIPCVAIGGITPQNCAPLVKAGADFIAVITAVWAHKAGPAEAIKLFTAAIKK